MNLPDSDINYLVERGLPYEVLPEAGMICVLFPSWKLPEGYSQSAADLLLRLHPGYPDIPPDMWWFDPAVQLADGRVVQATESVENYLGRNWQRWSRHLAANHWLSGIDGLESYLAVVNRELERCALEPVR